jgi:hypothetical protein
MHPQREVRTRANVAAVTERKKERKKERKRERERERERETRNEKRETCTLHTHLLAILL